MLITRDVPTMQTALSALLLALGFDAMSRDAAAETDRDRLQRYARIIVKNTPASHRAAVVVSRGDEDIAERIMSARCQPADESDAVWELQRLRGALALALALGYTSIEMLDECGESWLCLPGCTIAPATDNAEEED